MTTFCNPASARETFVNVQLELLSAADFNCDRLYVRYTFHLPAHCRIIPDPDDQQQDDDNVPQRRLSSSTHLSQRRSHENVWSLCGPPHELNLLCNEYYNDRRLQREKSIALRLTYAVYTLDRWKRERLIGAAVQSVRLDVAGSDTHRVQCFRMTGSRHREPTAVELDEFLLLFGQQQPSSSRCGVGTETAGRLSVRTHVVVQRSRSSCAHVFQDDTGLGGGGRQQQDLIKSSVDCVKDVMEAYERAKQRLLATAFRRESESLFEKPL